MCIWNDIQCYVESNTNRIQLMTARQFPLYFVEGGCEFGCTRWTGEWSERIVLRLWICDRGTTNGLFGWSGGCQKIKKLIPRYFFCYGQIFSENFFFFFFNFLSPITYGFCEALNICSIIDKGTTESARTKLFSHERPKLGNHPVRVLMEMDNALGFRNKSLH